MMYRRHGVCGPPGRGAFDRQIRRPGQLKSYRRSHLVCLIPVRYASSLALVLAWREQCLAITLQVEGGRRGGVCSVRVRLRQGSRSWPRRPRPCWADQKGSEL